MPAKESLLLASDMIRILIAEDDDSLREILQEFLGASQRTIQTYRNGEEALPALGKSMFDIVITDLMMPGVDGLQVLREAKDHRHFVSRGDAARQKARRSARRRRISRYR